MLNNYRLDTTLHGHIKKQLHFHGLICQLKCCQPGVL